MFGNFKIHFSKTNESKQKLPLKLENNSKWMIMEIWYTKLVWFRYSNALKKITALSALLDRKNNAEN